MVGNGFALTDNIATYSVETDCSSDPKDVFSYMQGTIDVDGNVFAAAASQTATLWSAYGHNTTVVPSLGAVGLTPDQFALSPSSPFKAAGPGADLSCFVESAVRNGKPSLYCPVPGVATVPLPPQAPTLSVGPLMPRIYPNPWRSDRHSGKQVIFDNLPSQTTVKIFTASGHLVKELNGTGTIPWNLTNEKGDKVASGVYIYLVTDGQGNKAKGKVALVR